MNIQINEFHGIGIHDTHMITLVFFLVWFSTKALKTLSSKNLKLIKHIKFKFHGIKNVFLENTLPLHEMLLWDHIGLCTQASKFPLHKNPHSKEMGYNDVYHTHIYHKNSSHDLHWNPCFL
jgi:hypothetical protein